MTEKNELQRIINQQRAEIDELKRDVAERDATIRSLDSVNLQLRNEIMRLEQELKIRIDVEL